MSNNNQHSFWGSLSPLGGLTGAGLLIMTSARLSWSITVAGSLFWVYGLSTFTYIFLFNSIGGKFFPVKGRTTLFACLAAFYGSVYLFLFWLLCPFAAFETFMLLMLVPLFFASSGFIEQIHSQSEKSRIDVLEYLSNSVSQAASLGGLIIAFSIIREPLSYNSLSFPGTSQGMVLINFGSGSFIPINIFASSAGALLLLGFIICLYQYNKSKIFSGRT